MSFPTNRSDFQDRCLRALGAPVIEINVDEDQVADRVDDAVLYYWDFHYDGTEKMFFKHQITANDMLQQYIDLPNNIIGVKNIIPLTNTGEGIAGSSDILFNLNYQLKMNDVYNLSQATTMTNYVMTRSHLDMIQMLLNGIPGIRFNKRTNRLYIDVLWGKEIKENDFVILDCYQVLNPDQYTAMWEDPWLFKYSTALIKKQWGTNMKKFTGVVLPGGITLDGKTIYDEAVEEIKELEIELRDTFEEPPMFTMG